MLSGIIKKSWNHTIFKERFKVHTKKYVNIYERLVNLVETTGFNFIFSDFEK